MVRRRSMALSAAGENAAGLGVRAQSSIGEKHGSRRWSEAPDSTYPTVRGSMVKYMGDEERLDAELAMARRNSREHQEMALSRAS